MDLPLLSQILSNARKRGMQYWNKLSSISTSPYVMGTLIDDVDEDALSLTESVKKTPLLSCIGDLNLDCIGTCICIRQC